MRMPAPNGANAQHMCQDGKRKRMTVAFVDVCLLVLPVLLLSFPPVTDLPQHVAQVRLFWEAYGHPDGIYVIQWLAPNNLLYVLLLALAAVLPIEVVGSAALVIIISGWVVAIHWLAWRTQRPAAAAVVASLLIYGLSLSWGLLNFLIGFPVFVLWFVLTMQVPTRNLSWARWLMLATTALLLYESHALWFAVAIIWL